MHAISIFAYHSVSNLVSFAECIDILLCSVILDKIALLTFFLNDYFAYIMS